MADINQDLSVLDELNFNITPVGIKFLRKKPAGIARLREKAALCEMLKKTQDGNVFYTGMDDHTCGGGKHVAGGKVEDFYTDGSFGAGLQVFNSAGPAANIYEHVPAISKGTVKYIAFSPLGRLSFRPDVLVILADTTQAEILLRAVTYKTGDIWESRTSVVIGCAWAIVYPYLTSRLNYFSTGFGHGMRRRKLFPEGMHIISIPSQLLPSIMQALSEMPWELPAFESDGDKYVEKLLKSLRKK
jgi:uncharacterized protein (DUF169 family)